MEARTCLTFAGMLLQVTDQGLQVAPDLARIRAIKEYSTPTDIESLRRFLGLTEALRDFIPDLAHSTSAMRELLKKKNIFLWTAAQQSEFEAIREVLASPSNLACFNPTLAHTDTSLFGLGFILYQVREDGSKALIHCGSSAVSPTQARYSVYKLELLAIMYAVKKSDY